jgi:hypothetical protein
MSTDEIDEPRPARKLSVEVENFRAHRSGSLYGFIDVSIAELRMRFRDCTVHASANGDRKWIGLPSKPQVARDGTVRRDEQGRILYSPVIEIVRRRFREAFSDRVIAALLERFPLAFDEAAA